MSPCKLSEQNLENFTMRGPFSKKRRTNCSKHFLGLSTSSRHNSAMITKAENLRLNDPPTGCLVSIFTIRINSKSSPGLYAPYDIANLKCLRLPATKKWNATPDIKILVLSHPLGDLGQSARHMTNSSHVTSWPFNFTQLVTSWPHMCDELTVSGTSSWFQLTPK